MLERDSRFDTRERQLIDSAQRDLPALAVAQRATVVLASVIEGTTVPPENPATPSYYLRAATLFLSVIGLRTARACLLVITAGYWPEAHGLKRRLSEVHARAQAVGQDESGQHARQWLEGPAPSTPRKIFGKFASLDLYDLYSWGAHANAEGAHVWLSMPMGEGQPVQTGLQVIPQHDEPFSNALLTEVAMECRDLAAAQGAVRNDRAPDLGELDAEIEPLIARYYNRAPAEPRDPTR